ncbi:MAG: hypothetical protein GC168_17220 [Candidatus Hydrogenedens sp.]|nr:hypothetical protein [Candidatus Hydrogenedens sp.]
MAVAATPVPGLTVETGAGYAFIDGAPFRLQEPLESTSVTPPAGLDRIDLVAAVLDSGGVVVVQGVESASPSAPAVPAGHLALAYLYLRPGMTSIKNLDDATNGYIIDQRVFV